MKQMALAKNKTVIIVGGPTAAGNPVAIELAKKFETEIISADSRQCFKIKCWCGKTF
jgi:tRNA dimethylallyltransferase